MASQTPNWALGPANPGISLAMMLRQAGLTISVSICTVFALYMSHPQLRTRDLSSGEHDWYCGISRNGIRLSRKSSFPSSKNGCSSCFLTQARLGQVLAIFVSIVMLRDESPARDPMAVTSFSVIISQSSNDRADSGGPARCSIIYSSPGGELAVEHTQSVRRPSGPARDGRISAPHRKESPVTRWIHEPEDAWVSVITQSHRLSPQGKRSQLLL